MALARWRRVGLSAVNSFSGGFIFVVGWVFVQALQLAALSLALSHGREDGQLLGFSFTVMETNGAGCFFRRPFIGLDSGSL